MEMDPIDTKVMDIDKNILTNIGVDIDSDIDGTVVILGDNNNEAWSKTAKATPATPVTQNKVEEQKPVNFKTPVKKNNENIKTNKIDDLKCKILEEELEFKQCLHEEEMKINLLEREHREIY
ncbi:uncharacterized protein [Choristoneura fumiferana]|uniref:uncharacterized protein n=1 Tax=Choristoneura fumiferana TaxID=7141 RepID=UPI003D15EBE6